MRAMFIHFFNKYLFTAFYRRDGRRYNTLRVTRYAVHLVTINHAQFLYSFITN